MKRDGQLLISAACVMHMLYLLLSFSGAELSFLYKFSGAGFSATVSGQFVN